MSHTNHSKAPSASQAGPLDWRSLVQWLLQDGVINAAEAQRVHTRCAQAESAQHPMLRLASVAVRRASDDKPLDIELLTQWLAGRAQLAYLRIDPLKVDVGKVADTMSPAYAERHKILPVQVTAHEVVVADGHLAAGEAALVDTLWSRWHSRHINISTGDGIV